MANGKIRAEAHIIDQQAILTVKGKLPRAWVIRELTPDYGLDLDVELFEKENGQIVTLGERLYIQVKGTTNAIYDDVQIDTGSSKATKRCLSFSLDTALLRLVERVGDSLPILLAVVDINSEDVFFVCLNDYVDFVLGDDDKWRLQETKTVKIPCENKIESVNLLRWYAIRPKLNSFFVEAAALMVDVEYEVEAEGYIKDVKKFALKYANSDVWNCEKINFAFLDKVHSLIEDIINDRECSESALIFSSFSEHDLISSGNYDNMSISLAKQFYTAQRLIQELGTANSIFLSCIRQLFNITKYEAEVSINKEVSV